MPRITFVLTCAPDPRLRKRIQSFINYNFIVKLIFAEREGLDGFVKNIPQLEAQRISVKIKDADNLLGRLFSLFIFLRKTTKIIRAEKLDIIYICGLDGLLISVLGNWHKRALVFYEVSDLPGGRWRRDKLLVRLIDWLERLVIKNTDKVIMSSPYFYPEKYQKHGVEIMVLENMPEKRLFGKYKRTAHSDFVVGFFGLVRDKKSIESLIKALGGISGVRVVIAGSATMDDKDYRAIICMASGYNNIEFKGRYDYENEIVGLYSSIDCVYSVYDKNDENTNLAMGNKLYEAIVCCLPIIVTKNSKMAEFVETAGIGFSVNSDNPEEIRNVVLGMMEDKAAIKKIENNCMAMRENYYYEKKEREFISGVNNMLDNQKGSS